MSPKVKNEGTKKTPRRRQFDKNSEDYKDRRDRNNEAVKKSRQKSREKAKETVDRVKRLRNENEELEQQVVTLSKELGVLKDLFMMAHGDSASPACAAVLNKPQDCDTLEHSESETCPEVNRDALLKDHEYSMNSL